jgi:hypothetical protein
LFHVHFYSSLHFLQRLVWEMEKNQVFSGLPVKFSLLTQAYIVRGSDRSPARPLEPKPYQATPAFGLPDATLSAETGANRRAGIGHS